MKAPLREALYLATNAALFAVSFPVQRSARVRWEEPLDELVALRAEGSVIFCGLHRYGWVLFYIFGRHVPAALHPRVVGHDGPWSRGQTRAGQWGGYRVLEYTRQGASPREQLIEALRREPGALALLSDSGGPYGVVKPGVVEIARAVGAAVVPFAVDGRWGCASVGSRQRHVVALPCAELVVLRGRALRGAELEVEALQQEVDALERRVRRR